MSEQSTPVGMHPWDSVVFQRKGVALQLFITTRGAYVHVSGEIFEVKVNRRKVQFAPQKIVSIVLATDAAISTEALRLAFKYNVDVLVLDSFGSPMGRFWHSRFGSTAAIRRAQLEAADREIGLKLAKEWIGERLHGQAELLRKLGRARQGDIAESMFESAKLITRFGRQLRAINGFVGEVRGSLMGIEGSAARIYFDALNEAIPEQWKFEGRSRTPAKNPFNAFLNYALGVLYGICERAIVLAGMDPYVGFLHTDNYNKLALVFDIIEPRRVWAEDVVFHLFSGRKVKPGMYDEVPGGYTLNADGKKLLMEKFNSYLDHVVTYKKRKLSRRNTVLYDCHRTAGFLLGRGETTFIKTKEL